MKIFCEACLVFSCDISPHGKNLPNLQSIPKSNKVLSSSSGRTSDDNVLCNISRANLSNFFTELKTGWKQKKLHLQHILQHFKQVEFQIESRGSEEETFHQNHLFEQCKQLTFDPFCKMLLFRAPMYHFREFLREINQHLKNSTSLLPVNWSQVEGNSANRLMNEWN